MNKRLTHNLTSAYIEAANRLNSKRSRKRIVAYSWRYSRRPASSACSFRRWQTSSRYTSRKAVRSPP